MDLEISEHIERGSIASVWELASMVLRRLTVDADMADTVAAAAAAVADAVVLFVVAVRAEAQEVDSSQTVCLILPLKELSRVFSLEQTPEPKSRFSAEVSATVSKVPLDLVEF